MWNCQICQKEMDNNSPNTDTNYNVSFYHSERPKKPGERSFIMCKNCYQTNEQEYLNNYERIFKETEKEGFVYIKKPEMGCYASQKDKKGEVLRQENCSHCQPWKFPVNNGNQVKCANCGAEIRDTKYFDDEKLFCSQECADIYKQNLPKSTETCLVCGKNISEVQEKWTYTNHQGEKKTFCSSECFLEREQRKPPMSNPPPKPQNINKGMPTEIKVAIGVGIALLFIFIVGLIGAKKKKKKVAPNKHHSNIWP